MDLRLDGRTAVVTGASRGIGLAVTRGLAAEGVHVTAGARKSSAELDEPWLLNWGSWISQFPAEPGSCSQL